MGALTSANESGGVDAILLHFYSDAACPYNQFWEMTELILDFAW